MREENYISNLITVVVPIYNMGQYLDRAMKSLLNQTYSNYELLLVDDGSTDGSAEKCDEYGRNYKIVTVYHKENGGLSSARNCGLNHANGNYIIFPDPDDWVSINYLENLVSLMNDTSDLEVCGHYVVTDKERKAHSGIDKIYELNREEAMISAMTPSGFCGFAGTKLYHMEIIRKNNLRFDEELGMAQDLHFLIRYLMCCTKVIYNTKPLYFYYQHVGGVTNAPLSLRKLSGLKAYEKIVEIVRTEYPNIMSLAKSTYVNMSLQFMFLYFEMGMSDLALLKKLKSNLKNNLSYFLKNRNYSMPRKLLGIAACISPRFSFEVRKTVQGKEYRQ